MKKLLFYLLLFFILQQQGFGQDIHFSQFNWSYLNLNPAHTGQFNGDYRFNGNFKNQWGAISEPYQTFSFAADAKGLISSYTPLNIGLVAFNDEAGLGGLQTTSFGLSAAQEFGLNTDSSLRLSAGISMGIVSKRINFNAFSFDAQYNGNQFDPNRSNRENFDRSSYTNFSLQAGLLLQYQLARRKSFQFGLAAFNLTAPNQSFQGASIPLDQRFNIHALGDLFLSPKIDLIPSLLYSRQGKFQEILMGSNLRYRLNESDFLRQNLYGGIWYRNKDAIIAGIGMDYMQWKAGISYDINLSELDEASDNRGGIEISVVYIIKEFKPSLRKYKKCPRFL